jgi:hypothetical protein
MPAEMTFEKEDIATAIGGADVYYRGAARDEVAKLSDWMTLADLINRYCTDAELAKKQVTTYLGELPSNDELVARAFTLYELLLSTRNDLADIVGLEKELLEEAAKGKGEKAVDDDRIRESAGYDDVTDEEVAESSKTDRAKEDKVTDADIGKSALDEVTYVDRTMSSSPAVTFMVQTRRLAREIVDHCLNNGDVYLLVEAGLVREDPKALGKQIMDITDKLEPPRDEDK